MFSLKGKFSILQLNVRSVLTLKVVYRPGETVIHGSVFFNRSIQTSANFGQQQTTLRSLDGTPDAPGCGVGGPVGGTLSSDLK